MYLTTKQVAEKLDKSERTICAWLKAGKIQGKKVNGKWQIIPSSVENLCLPVQKKKTVAKEATVKEQVNHIENLECIHEFMDSISKALQDIQANAIVETQKAQEQKKKEIEILSRVVKNQKQLKEENAQLKKQSLFLQASVRKMAGQLLQLKKENEMLKQSVEKIHSEQANSYSALPSNSKELQSNSSSNGQETRSSKPIKSEQRAEKWARNNIHEWFQKPCKTSQLSEFTYEEIALNKAPKANINGNMQPSRAYLHVLAKKGTTWVKFKAIVALEITADKKEMYSKAYNHYNHPNEIGG